MSWASGKHLIVYSGIACLGGGVKNACHLFCGNLFYFQKVTGINFIYQHIPNIFTEYSSNDIHSISPIHASIISNFDAQLTDESLCLNFAFSSYT